MKATNPVENEKEGDLLITHMYIKSNNKNYEENAMSFSLGLRPFSLAILTFLATLLARCFLMRTLAVLSGFTTLSALRCDCLSLRRTAKFLLAATTAALYVSVPTIPERKKKKKKHERNCCNHRSIDQSVVIDWAAYL